MLQPSSQKLVNLCDSWLPPRIMILTLKLKANKSALSSAFNQPVSSRFFILNLLINPNCLYPANSVQPKRNSTFLHLIPPLNHQYPKEMDTWKIDKYLAKFWMTDYSFSLDANSCKLYSNQVVTGQ